MCGQSSSLTLVLLLYSVDYAADYSRIQGNKLAIGFLIVAHVDMQRFGLKPAFASDIGLLTAG